MRERKIRAGLVGRVKETIRKTRSRVGVEGKMEEDFLMVRGVRQGYSLLFNILLADLEEKMGRVK